MIVPLRRSGRNLIRLRAGAFALLTLMALGAGACGRRGALEPPPDPNAIAKPEDPAHPQVHHKPKPIEPPKQPFFLDFLL